MSGRCIFCGSANQHLVLALGRQPLANSYLTSAQLHAPEPVFPLDLYVCEDCMLCHIEPVASPEQLFGDYAYFASYSTTWLAHAKAYVDMITDRLGLDASSRVVELASNDGYLLQYFNEQGIPCLGIEPAANVAEAARAKGIPTRVCFFGRAAARDLAQEGFLADLIIGNNVLAHVPEPNEFVAGLKILLKPQGVVTMEFPHLYRLVEENQFDTIYHEHFSYFAFFVVKKVFAAHGLTVFDVEELPTHGGSLRVYARHEEDASRPVAARVAALLEREEMAGMTALEYYERFGARVAKVKEAILAFMQQARKEGKRIVGYGAPAKGNTLLNYCGIGTDYIDYTVDRNPHKQGLYLPGTHIPIRAPVQVREDRPDYLFILPWNLTDEIVEQMQHIREWGGQFVAPIPEVRIIQ